jgi:uncharacterized membrane protein YqjE
MPTGPGAPPSSNLLESLKRLGRTLVALLHTRLEILGTELEEERIRFGRMIILAVTVAFLFNAALLLGVSWLVAALWDRYGHATLGVLALALLAAAVGLFVYARGLLKTRPKPFATTLAELAKDRERLTGHRAGEAAE